MNQNDAKQVAAELALIEAASLRLAAMASKMRDNGASYVDRNNVSEAANKLAGAASCLRLAK